MKIKTVGFAKTINIGNYQSVRVEFTAELEPEKGDTAETVLLDLKNRVAHEEKLIKGM
jgi:hypothetical protein